MEISDEYITNKVILTAKYERAHEELLMLLSDVFVKWIITYVNEKDMEEKGFVGLLMTNAYLSVATIPLACVFHKLPPQRWAKFSEELLSEMQTVLEEAKELSMK